MADQSIRKLISIGNHELFVLFLVDPLGLGQVHDLIDLFICLFHTCYEKQYKYASYSKECLTPFLFLVVVLQDCQSLLCLFQLLSVAENFRQKFLFLRFLFFLLGRSSQVSEVILLLVHVFLLLQYPIMRFLGNGLHLVPILMQADTEACPLSLDVFPKLLLPLVSFHLHCFDPRVEQFVLLFRTRPLLLDLRCLILFLNLLDGILQHLPLKNCLQSIGFDLVLESLLQILSVLLLQQLDVSLQFLQPFVELLTLCLHTVELTLDKGQRDLLLLKGIRPRIIPLLVGDHQFLAFYYAGHRYQYIKQRGEGS